MRLLLLSVLLAAAAQAQTGAITGTVRDAATGEVMPGTNIHIVGTRLGASTNADGVFTIRDVPVGTYEIQASFVGHTPVSRSVTVLQGTPVVADVALETSALICCCIFTEDTGPRPVLSRGPFQARVAEIRPERERFGCCQLRTRAAGTVPMTYPRDA